MKRILKVEYTDFEGSQVLVPDGPHAVAKTLFNPESAGPLVRSLVVEGVSRRKAKRLIRRLSESSDQLAEIETLPFAEKLKIKKVLAESGAILGYYYNVQPRTDSKPFDLEDLAVQEEQKSSRRSLRERALSVCLKRT